MVILVIFVDRTKANLTDVCRRDQQTQRFSVVGLFSILQCIRLLLALASFHWSQCQPFIFDIFSM